MKIFYSFIISCISILGYSQTILYQSESTSRTVQDPQTVILTEGFHAKSDVSNPFIAKIGPGTENPGGGPIDSGAGVGNPTGTIETTDNKFHDTKGNIEVNGVGQLQFTLPIALPPGVKSVAPQINLTYNSSSGNGIAGYGWNLSGITSISRIGKNIEKDGGIKGIQLDYSDYYNFNGQRLILKSGEYGKDGAEYVTEKYSNVKIKSIGAVTGQLWQGPEYWELTFEDGSQAWYGAAVSGNSTARTPLEYNIVKWKDAQGNYISYNYTQTTSTNVAVISSIEWGGNEGAGKPHFNKIELNYFNERILNEINYLSGIKFVQNKQLKEIIVKTNGNQFKRYAVEYINNGASYQFANKIIEYNSNDQAANPITIGYEPYQSGNEETTKENNIATNNTKKYGDFDMDGITDYLEFIPNPGSSPSGPVGSIHFKNSVYKDSPVIPMQYELSRFTAEEFAKATAVTFKKDGYVKNKIGIVIPHKVATSDPNKPNYELLIYSADTSNFKFKLEYSKVIPYSIYTPGGELSGGSECTASVPLNVSYLESYDYDGDGISELMIGFNRRNRCTSAPYADQVSNIENNGIAEPTDSQLTLLQPQINSSNVEYGDDIINIIPPGGTIDLFTYYSSFLVDIDENIDINNSIYKYDEGVNMNNSLDNNKNNRFADLNGDGIQDIIRIKSDGTITDAYNYHKQPAGNYVKINIGDFSGQKFEGIFAGALFGDFNGDSKVDVLVPQTNKSYNWNLYISDGKKFNQSTINNFIYYSSGGEVLMESSHNVWEAGGGCSYSESRYFQYNVADLDADGKSDIVVSYVFINNHEWSAHHDQEKTVLRTFVYSVNKTTTDNSANFAKKFLSSAGGDYNVSLLDSPIQTNGDLHFYRVRDWRREYAEKVIPFGTLSLNRTNQQIISIGRPDDCSGVIGCAYNYVTQYDYSYVPTLARAKFIKQGGITTEVSYQDLNSIADTNFYKPIKKELFPYFELEQIPLSVAVSRLKQNIPNGTLIQDFRYRGFIIHLTGKGMIGLRQSAHSSWYSEGLENTKIWSGAEIDPLNDGVPLKEWSIKTNNENLIFPTDISENNTQLLSFKSIIYQADKLLNGQVVPTVTDADRPKVVTAFIPTSTKTKDFLTGTLTTGSITYGDYYLPAQSISNVNNGYAITTSNFEYIHNPSGAGPDYYIGRPKTKIDAIQVYGDTKSAKEEYTYENNLLKTQKTWNRDNTGYLHETYNYDGLGNITQKTISNSIDSQTQTTTAQYDPKGRFVVKKTDNLGLETSIEYNDWGQIKKQTDPLGNTLTNTYDNWGKLETSKTNLAGITTYTYEKDNQSNIIVTQYDSDGEVSKKFTNKLGQNYKTSIKAFGQGQYISKEIQYDILGRKLKESEPYFEGQSTNQWNTIAYDDNFFPAKVTTTSFNGKKMETTVSGNTTTIKEVNLEDYGRTNSKTTDALGNVVSTTDKGGTIQFSYNAAGEQIKAQYAENMVTTKYDSWGRKSEFNDPSNGLYKYEYDGFGQPKKIISPKGTKEFTYNSLGQLISQKELSTTDGGQATNKIISYSYDDKGRIISKSGTSKGKAYSSNVVYDPQGRLLSSSENSNGRYFIQKGITYDDKARIISYEKQLYSSGVLTKVQIENVYSTWNGELYQVKDKVTGKSLWELQGTNVKGQVLSAKLGASNITNLYDDTTGFLKEIKHLSPSQQSILNIQYTFNAVKNELNLRKTLGNFNIIESFNYDDNNRLISWTNPKTGQLSQNTYDVKGRILENDQVGTMKYENSAKIYQPTGMTLNAAGTQNYNNDLIQSIVYNENNDPVFIDGMKGDVAFQYGLTSMRQKVTYRGNFSIDGDGKFTKFYNEDGSFEVVKDNTTGKEKHVLYIGGTPYESNIIYLKNYDETAGSYKFLHKDYIGSILAISDEAGNKLEQRHFDAWGNFTHLQIGNGPIITDKNIIDTTSLLLERGYTSHEHFAEVGIIHMNGRLYDPLLRRFLNADENIQDPTNTQNYNKYGYVLNNPLMFNDPNGEWIVESAFLSAVIIGAMVASFSYTVGVSISGQNWDLGKSLKTTLLSAAVAAVTYGIGPVFSGAGFWAAVGNGAVSGAVSGAITSIVNGTDFIKGILMGATIGGAMGGISYIIQHSIYNKNYTNKGTTSKDIKGNTNYDSSLTNDQLTRNISETQNKLFKPNEDFGVGEQTIGKTASNGYLDMGENGAKQFLAYTGERDFWTGASNIMYSPRAAADKYLLKFIMLHETGHAYSNAFFLPDMKIDIKGVYSDTTEHLALAFSEHDIANINGLSFRPRSYFSSQYTLDETLKKLTQTQMNFFNRTYQKLSPIFNRTIK
ncbi:RHS repeat-associated core domain-containing protein [Chryseobacterium luteum]|uniref:RHS repeat-associated core domain-containing protein n=1 Tax=Chryseobacterium luteum TaxID=421531 RepID=UPI000691D79B|nr:RHS repeat-associated core domain-containing protein [Chryseobacterium luteum]